MCVRNEKGKGKGDGGGEGGKKGGKGGGGRGKRGGERRGRKRGWVVYVFEDADFGGHAFDLGFVLVFEF